MSLTTGATVIGALVGVTALAGAVWKLRGPVVGWWRARHRLRVAQRGGSYVNEYGETVHVASHSEILQQQSKTLAALTATVDEIAARTLQLVPDSGSTIADKVDRLVIAAEAAERLAGEAAMNAATVDDRQRNFMNESRKDRAEIRDEIQAVTAQLEIVLQTYEAIQRELDLIEEE